MENSVSWIGDLGFKCTNRNHEIILDVSKEDGSQDRGPTPKEVLLSSSATCAAMDVIYALKKMRSVPDDFKVEIESKKNTDYPIHFTEITLHFILNGKTQAKHALQAVELSLTKYCGVSYMISKVTRISYTVRLNGEEVGKGVAKFADPVS